MIMLAPLLKKLLPDYLAFWRTICTMETPSHDKAALNAQADYIESFAVAHGFFVRRIPHEMAGDTLVIETGGAPDLAPVALLAHMDTVHEKGVFGTPPVKEINGVMYGPGVFDCKGGIAVGLLAMEALKNVGGSKRPIRLLLDSDEENGSYLGEERVRFIEREVKGCIAAFNLEAGREGQLTVGRKGIITVAFTLQGVSGHAGNAYFESASAVREAAHLILALESASTEEGITCNCGKVRGGSATNVVPDLCVVEADIRYRDETGEKAALALLQALAAHLHDPACKIKYEILRKHPAMEAKKGNYALFALAASVARELGLGTLRPAFLGGGSDAAFTARMGIPTLCSMGVEGKYEHTCREEARIASLGERAILLTETIERLREDDLQGM